MKYLILIICTLTFACSQEAVNKPSNSNFAKIVPTPSPNLIKSNSTNTELEENLVFLDKKKKGTSNGQSLQNVRTSLDWLAEHTSSSREEIADITNKVVPELQKDGVKCSREEFLWVCKAAIQVHKIDEKLGEKPDFWV